MIKTRLTRKQIRLISFSLFLIGALAVSCIRLLAANRDYRAQLELSRQHALTELCESMDAITTALTKSSYSSSPETMEKLSASLSGEARCAKLALSEISDNIYTDDIYKFLSQVGAYTHSITTRLSFDSSERTENLGQLLAYAKVITDSLEQVAARYFNGEISFEESRRNLSFYKQKAPELFSGAVTDLQQTFTDCPTLIYDGPFSDHLGTVESRYLASLPEVSKDEARKKAAEVLEVDESSLTDIGDADGIMPLYCFEAKQQTLGVTKRGGRLCYIIYSGYTGESTITEEAAAERGLAFLEKLGYDSMVSSYYSVYDGVCTVNYAYESDGVICYPDLIKVGISLETGQVLSMDAATYLTNHRERETDFTLAPGDARKRISGELDIADVRRAVIPTDTEKEYVCYEVHCVDLSGNEALIYIDALTGVEREILILTYSDGGMLVQ